MVHDGEAVDVDMRMRNRLTHTFATKLLVAIRPFIVAAQPFPMSKSHASTPILDEVQVQAWNAMPD